MSISLIVLLEEQYEDFADYLLSMDQAFNEYGEEYEIVVVANGTGNFYRSQQACLTGLNSRLRAFEFATHVAQTVTLKAVLKEAKGETLVICGSYQQLSSQSLIACTQALHENTDFVSPWRQRRVDPFFNQLQSRVFNKITRAIVRTDLHDFSCTVKICRRSALEEIELYGNMFRFLPALAAAKGFRIKEEPVEHYQERGKTGFYRPSEYVNRLLDIFTIFFNTRFSRKPLRFFSGFGVGFVGIGIFLLMFLFIQRLFFGISMGNNQMLVVALLFAILGVLIAGAGLLGEVIVFANGRHKKEYMIEKKL